MGEMVREEILRRVKKAEVFSIIIDTTTDVSNLEQFSLVLRFVNEEGQTEERLVAMKEVPDSTGFKYNLDWTTKLCAQSYDGAASMQGQYFGPRSYVQEKNPNAIYIWCFAHILNLVVVDTCDKYSNIRNFFGDVQQLITYMRAKKRTAIFLEQQIKCYPSERPCRMKNFSTTRWTSHDRALSAITMVDVCAKKLSELRNEQSLNDLITKTKYFVNEIGLVECELPNIRSRRRKLLPGEIVSDKVITNPYEKFKIEVYYVVLDQVNTSIISRFEGARDILSNLSLLTFDRLKATREGTEIPQDNFIAFMNWIPNLTLDNLKMEYTIFASSFINLYNGIHFSSINSNKDLIIDSENETKYDSDSSNEIDSNEET
ncbi:zinc finger MYM-type protein 1-like [Sipha flava]|uniref:Zinc finger MYM-type protein 1-like n=1 Tax=Sipha flava TaxID=143950 RepID=A0A8B8GJ02_9HEMI|nr:zinc finger MYM-type protein 1-like [Sipha flava]